MEKNEIVIDGITYIKKENNEMCEMHMIRTQNAGVFFGVIHEKKDEEITIHNARRVWRWDGAASLSQLSQSGTSKPENCKFPMTVTEITLKDWVEIIPITEKALLTLNSVEVWTV